MKINDVTIVEEVRAAFARYENALRENDTEVLEALFWHSDSTVRFGAKETLIGIQDIRRFRSNRSKANVPRETLKTLVSAFGNDHATVSVLFRRADMLDQIGRWTLTWVRLKDGWRIVSAHVSSIGSQ